jgi:hypothetical protein
VASVVVVVTVTGIDDDDDDVADDDVAPRQMRKLYDLIDFYLNDLVFPTFLRYQQTKLSASGQEIGGEVGYRSDDDETMCMVVPALVDCDDLDDSPVDVSRGRMMTR